MKVICAWCRREGRLASIGEREPLDDVQETHGICRRHAERITEDLPSRSFPEVRVLLVVAPNEANLCRYLERSFATVRDVKVIVDRRRGERRSVSSETAVERRRGERRRRSGIVSPLGYRIVRFGARVSVPPTGAERQPGEWSL